MSGRYEAQTLRGLVEFLPHEPNFANSRRPILFEELLTILVSHFYRLRDERKGRDVARDRSRKKRGRENSDQDGIGL